MSLKTFHVLFITLSTLCALGFGGWAVMDFSRTGKGGTLAMGVGSFAAAGALVFYGMWFWRKLKGVSTT